MGHVWSLHVIQIQEQVEPCMKIHDKFQQSYEDVSCKTQLIIVSFIFIFIVSKNTNNTVNNA